jgi:two-component system response regulator NreC
VHPRVGALLAAENEETASGPLSAREREVVRLVALGRTNAQIATHLHVAERTIKTYRARALEKLGLSTRAEITDYAREHGLTD